MDNIETISIKELFEDLEDNKFELYYQPQFDNRQNLIGVEALLRYQNLKLKNVPVINLINLFEENNFIIPLGKWILEKVCEQLYIWSKSPITSNIIISVNISPKQVNDDNFISDVLNIIKKAKAPFHLLRLELTENVLIYDIKNTCEKIRILQSFNILFSLDDFGTGYASLEYIKHIKFDQIKIDKVFIQDLNENLRSIEIVKSIIYLANNLNISVLAEGVENELQKKILEKHTCNCYQGYFFGRPMPILRLESIYFLNCSLGL